MSKVIDRLEKELVFCKGKVIDEVMLNKIGEITESILTL